MRFGKDNAFLAAVKLPRGMLVGLFPVTTALTYAFHVDPRMSDYQVWCMEESGRIVYDEDPKQIGKNLFTDAMYASFPELLALGERIRTEPFGVGYYQFMAKGSKDVTYKIAAWDAAQLLPDTLWKIVVAYPYTVRAER
jgi:hypothetical protein